MKNELPHLLKPRSEHVHASHRLGVVLPILDTSPRLNQCLAALSKALAKAVDKGHQADLYVIIDGRNADSAAIASTFPVHLVTADFSDAASARAIGARAALSAGATWLAFTECDALVAESWLIEQVSSDSELLFGDVEITDGFMSSGLEDPLSNWRDLSERALVARGANFSNLGMSRSAFELASHLSGSELRLDTALLDRLSSLDVSTYRCSKPLVYARVHALNDIRLNASPQPARLKASGGFDFSPMHAMAPAAA